jgi:hypothetical protein
LANAGVTVVVVAVSTVAVVVVSTVAVDFTAAEVAFMAVMVAITAAADSATAVATEGCAEAQGADSALAEHGARGELMAPDRGALGLIRLRFATDSFIPSQAAVPLAD